MLWLNSVLLALLVALPFATTSVAGQETPQPPAVEPVQEFFSGTILDASESRISVSRTVLGRPPETREFVINADTKIEGKIRSKARVTVGFKATPEGDIAIRIIVRSGGKK